MPYSPCGHIERPTPGQSSIRFYFFFPLPLPALPFVDATLTARDVAVDVPLLAAPLLTAVICLFCKRQGVLAERFIAHVDQNSPPRHSSPSFLPVASRLHFPYPHH